MEKLKVRVLVGSVLGARAGETVEVSAYEARALVRLGRAELVGEPDGKRESGLRTPEGRLRTAAHTGTPKRASAKRAGTKTATKSSKGK